jgi:hypothetical protein
MCAWYLFFNLNSPVFLEMVSKQLFKNWRYTAYPRPGVAKAGPAKNFGKKAFLKDPDEKPLT